LAYGFQSNSDGVDWFNNNNGNIGLILARDKKSALLLFNDKGGDKDFDDMVIRVAVSAVPEPETFVMLLAGLGQMGFVARRRALRG